MLNYRDYVKSLPSDMATFCYNCFSIIAGLMWPITVNYNALIISVYSETLQISVCQD